VPVRRSGVSDPPVSERSTDQHRTVPGLPRPPTRRSTWSPRRIDCEVRPAGVVRRRDSLPPRSRQPSTDQVRRVPPEQPPRGLRQTPRARPIRRRRAGHCPGSNRKSRKKKKPPPTHPPKPHPTLRGEETKKNTRHRRVTCTKPAFSRAGHGVSRPGRPAHRAPGRLQADLVACTSRCPMSNQLMFVATSSAGGGSTSGTNVTFRSARSIAVSATDTRVVSLVTPLTEGV